MRSGKIESADDLIFINYFDDDALLAIAHKVGRKLVMSPDDAALAANKFTHQLLEMLLKSSGLQNDVDLMALNNLAVELAEKLKALQTRVAIECPHKNILDLNAAFEIFSSKLERSYYQLIPYKPAKIKQRGPKSKTMRDRGIYRIHLLYEVLFGEPPGLGETGPFPNFVHEFGNRLTSKIAKSGFASESFQKFVQTTLLPRITTYTTLRNVLMKMRRWAFNKDWNVEESRKQLQPVHNALR